MPNGYGTDRDIAYFQSTGDLSRTNVKAQEDLDTELAKQAKHGFMNSLIGTFMQFAVPAVLPGIGNMLGAGGGKILDFLTKKPLGKMLSSLGPKFLSEAIGTSMYKPGDYKSDTVYGESTFDDITQTGEDYKTAGYQKAGLSFLKDAIMSQMNNPFTKNKYGTLSEQVGIKPLEFGGYKRPETTTLSSFSRFPSTESIIPKQLGSTGVPTALPKFSPFGSTPFQDSLGSIPTSLGPGMHYTTDNLSKMASLRNLASEMNMGGRTSAFNEDLQSFIDLLGQGGK